MKKFLKWFLGLAAVGTAIGLIIAYFCKDSDAVSEYDCTEDMEEEDFEKLRKKAFEYMDFRNIISILLTG